MGRLYAILLFLAATAPPALADTYKWVDAKGVVNYSSTPPPAVAAKAQLVEERISVIPHDPTLPAAAAAMRARAQSEEEYWLQRQRYQLAAAQASYPAAYNSSSDPYLYSSGYGYYAPVLIAAGTRRAAPFFFLRPPAVHPGSRGGVRSTRGIALNR